MVPHGRRQRLGNVLLAAAGAMLMFAVQADAVAEPPPVTVELLRHSDAAVLPAYLLRVSIEMPVQGPFRRQGIARYACAITHGDPGLAALCDAEHLPDPVYHPPGSAGYQEPEYDCEGNLFLGMRSRWVALLTPTANEDYDEEQVFLVNPEGAVVKRLGLGRTLSCRAADNVNTWPLNLVDEVWWTLGQGISTDFERILSTSEDNELRRISVQSKRARRWAGVWHAAFQMEPSPIVREAWWIPDGLGEVAVKFSTTGMRQFGSVTLAEEGMVRFPFPGEPMRAHVILNNFEPCFDKRVFAEVQETLERARADETVDTRNCPSGGPAVTTRRLVPEKTVESDDR